MGQVLIALFANLRSSFNFLITGEVDWLDDDDEFRGEAGLFAWAELDIEVCFLICGPFNN